MTEKGGIAGKPFSDLEVHKFLLYYELVLKWNSRLHLTTLVDPLQFFQRHLLESDFAESLLIPEVAQVWDLGSGLGVPGIPVAILRPDITTNLVEAKLNKAMFLEEVLISLPIINAKVCNTRIESLTGMLAGDCLMARAVENMEEMVSVMMRIGRACSQVLFFGSESLGRHIKSHLLTRNQMIANQIPGTNKQLVFSIVRST